MKPSFKLSLCLFSLAVSHLSTAQIITTDPAIPVEAESVLIYFDATRGTGGLEGYTGDVYAHTGVPSSESITHMAFVFRSSDSQLEGKADGSADIFVEVFEEGLSVRIIRHDLNSIVDHETVTLVLYAPLKEHVFVIGDFNDWTPSSAYRMHQDGDRFWITLDKLTPGEIYGFQYLVDGQLLIADPYTQMTLDPEDRWIDESTYPGLKDYPTGMTTGIVSVLQTNQEPYAWDHGDFTAPEPEDLVIYKLLLRDFLDAHDWKTLTDTLDCTF